MDFEKQIAELQRQIDELRKHASASQKVDLRLPWSKDGSAELYATGGDLIGSIHGTDDAEMHARADFILNACNHYERLVKVVRVLCRYFRDDRMTLRVACADGGIELDCDSDAADAWEKFSDYLASLLRDCGEEVPS